MHFISFLVEDKQTSVWKWTFPQNCPLYIYHVTQGTRQYVDCLNLVAQHADKGSTPVNNTVKTGPMLATSTNCCTAFCKGFYCLFRFCVLVQWRQWQRPFFLCSKGMKQWKIMCVWVKWRCYYNLMHLPSCPFTLALTTFTSFIISN